MAGIYSLKPHSSPTEAAVRAIRNSLSREGDPLETFQDGVLFLAKVDFGCFGSPAFHDGVCVGAATGELILESGGTRAEALVELCRDLKSDDLRPLRRCLGSFSFCRYDPSSGEFMLGTDRLGVRAVYFHRTPEFLYFSSNLRVLEAVPEIGKEMDLRAVIEMLVCGVPLADRTPFAGIRNLRGGQVLSCRGGEVRVESYFRWRDLPATSLGREEFLDAAHTVFLKAVERRCGRDRAWLSFLSGGLDSRVVVAALRELGKEVHTITFNYPHLQDGPIAERFARSMGCRHTAFPVSHRDKAWKLRSAAPGKLRFESGGAPRFPNLVFSGDGGSVGVGHVYMDESLTRLMRLERVDDAVAHYLRNKALPRKVFRRDALDRLSWIPAAGVRAELAQAGCGDPARDFHVFLMENDQRRHLHYRYEDLDRSRNEPLLPFMDGEFLDLMGSAPMDWFLQHRLYHDWLKRFPDPVRRIPWQTYPGHLPCPVVEEAGSERPQWNLTGGERFAASLDLYKRCRRNLSGSPFPDFLLRRSMARLALLLHGARIRNLSHVCRVLDACQDYFLRAGGKVRFPDEEERAG